MAKTQKDLFKEKVAANGGQTGNSLLNEMNDVYRASYTSEYITGGIAKFPNVDWKDYLFSDPLKDVNGNIRTKEDGTAIVVRGIGIEQGGEIAKLTWTSLQKDIRICTKEGDTIADRDGNPVRVKSSGNVVDLWHALKGDISKFMDKLKGKTVEIKIGRYYQKSRFNPEPQEVTVPVITCSEL